MHKNREKYSRIKNNDIQKRGMKKSAGPSINNSNSSNIDSEKKKSVREQEKFILTIFLGFILGIIASVLAWFITSKVIVPNIEFSENICKAYPEYMSAPKYSFRIRNIGKRDIMDIDIYFGIRIKGLDPSSSDVVSLVVPVGFNSNKITILRTSSKDFYGTTLEIKLNQCEKFKDSIFPAYIRKKYEQKELTLEDIYSLGTNVETLIVLMGYDKFSGSRKFFNSKPYKLNNIIEGHFMECSMDIKR